MTVGDFTSSWGAFRTETSERWDGYDDSMRLFIGALGWMRDFNDDILAA